MKCPHLALSSLRLAPNSSPFALCTLRFILPRMPFIHAALMVIAAFVAGIVNSIAGGGTLLTFPLLIWIGLDPKVANATSTVALWPGLVGGMIGYRRELADSRTILTWLGITSL